MLLPTTNGAMVLALILTALFWGLWASTLRMDKKYRFELYAFDFAFGALLTALLLAFTLGNAGSSNTFTFDDNLTVASKRNMALAVAAGGILCLGNIMTLAGTVLGGMSSALPVATGVAMMITVLLQMFGKGMANPALVYGAGGVALASILVAAMAQKAVAAATPVRRGMHASWKGFILSCVGGLALGIYPLVGEVSRAGEIGLGSYGAVVFMTAGAVLMTPLYNLYFLNLPVQGDALSVLAYFKASAKQHVFGLAGGALWACGAVALYAAASATYVPGPKFLGVQAAGFAGAIVAALCGLTVWGEPAGAPKAKGMLFGAAGILAAGVAMLYLGA